MRKEVCHPAVYEIDTVDIALLESVIEDDVAEKAVNTIVETGSTGHFGDGRVFLIDIALAVDIRTGSTGTEAITR